jgi:hypothetical protein
MLQYKIPKTNWSPQIYEHSIKIYLVILFVSILLALNGTHHFLVCADDIWKKCEYFKKNTEALLDPSKEVYLDVNTEKTEYVFWWLPSGL